METFTKNQVVDAIESFLEYGEKTFVEEKEIGGLGQKGYFSGNGWAARCLRYHLEELKGEQE